MGLSELPEGAGPDSVSLMPALVDPDVAPLRTTVYSGQNRSGQPGSGFTGGFTLRDAQYKWVSNEDGTEELYDLLADPTESTDLSTHTSMAAVVERLRDEALELRGESAQ